MKIFNKITTYLFVGLLFAGCDKFLDKEYDASLSEDKVFTNKQLTYQFLANIYTSLPDGLGQYADPQFGGASHDVLTDNAQTSWGLHVYNRMNLASFTAADNPMGGLWADNLRGIRKANKFLENSYKAGISNRELIGSDENKLFDRYNAEARLLRALFHFQLVCYFGDIPIVEKSFSMSDQNEMNMERTNAADALKWIANECDSVKTKLPFCWLSSGNWGRVNGAAALALKSRALLYRASALNNKNDDKTWWTEAANSAMEFLKQDTLNNNPYKLYRGDGANSYGAMFYKQPTTINEFILTRSVWYTRAIDDACVPPGFANCTGRVNPTQNFVDAYEDKFGVTISKSIWYNAKTPYINRDPRLVMTVFHNGMLWGNPTKRALEIYKGGMDITATAGTLTGYYLKKWCSPDINYTDPRDQPRAWVIFRFAEIMLNYCEAANEASETPNATIFNFLDSIRGRAGFAKTVKVSRSLSQAQLRDKIRYERRIELAFEDHRYFDVRRWKLWDDPTILSNGLTWKEEMITIGKVTVEKSGTAFNYTFSTPDNLKRQFFPKMYFFPIPYDQVLKAPKLGQNPGW